MTSSDDQLAVRATILLGELLHMVIMKCDKYLWHVYSFIVLSSTLKEKLSLNICACVLLQNKHFNTLEVGVFWKTDSYNSVIVILILDAYFIVPPPVPLLFRQTPSFHIPTVTTCTAFPPSSTWQPPLTLHSRNDCEYTQTCIFSPNKFIYQNNSIYSLAIHCIYL